MSATFNFPPVGIPQHHDQLHATIQSDNGTPSPNFSAFSSAMAPSQHFRDAPSSPPPAMVIDALLIDNLAKDFQLEPVQRANLHAFVQIKIGSADGTLSKSDLLTRTYMLAAVYSDAAERHQVAQSQGTVDMKGVFTDIKTRLEGHFELTKDQNANIRKSANDMIYNYTRTNFITMNVDLMKYIRENHAVMGFSNVIGNAARERVLSSGLKKTCSSVRNAFRQDIRDSIIGPTACSLATFTYHTANKYRRGAFEEDLNFGYTIHNALLRRFGLDNLDLIRKQSTANSDNSSEAPETDSTPTGTKRQRTQGGRIVKGEDFWGRVDTWFFELVTRFGRDLTGARWREYVNEIIRQDNAQFGPNTSNASSSQVTAQGASLASAFSGF